jgi:hypothetical protein
MFQFVSQAFWLARLLRVTDPRSGCGFMVRAGVSPHTNNNYRTISQDARKSYIVNRK